jgi:hypothetical protein
MVTAVSLDRAIDLCVSDEEWIKHSLFLEDFLFVYRYYLSPHEFLPRLISKYPAFFFLFSQNFFLIFPHIFDARR